jgi:lipoprotein-anchoring transpeptidase ErfK/SrfK
MNRSHFPTRLRYLAAGFAFFGAMLPAAAFAGSAALASVNDATLSSAVDYQSRAVIVKAQVLLDRAGFSSGVIDGHSGENFVNALTAFQRQNGLPESGDLDAATWAKLTASSPLPAMTEYTISASDLRGPFAPEIPDTMEKMTELKRLDYRGPRQMLAERFHIDESLLQDLNPRQTFNKAGAAIVVTDVARVLPREKVVRIEVDKANRVVRAFEADGTLVGVYPASIGSASKPAPSGTLKITRIIHNPVYYYDPRFNFPGVEAKSRLKIAPGPNNPVGAVWMNLNAPSFGIHGTAEPGKVGKIGSHGCVRMTNWDAWALAAMVRPGTTVQFIE